jgi:hypothetical protein
MRKLHHKSDAEEVSTELRGHVSMDRYLRSLGPMNLQGIAHDQEGDKRNVQQNWSASTQFANMPRPTFQPRACQGLPWSQIRYHVSQHFEGGSTALLSVPILCDVGQFHVSERVPLLFPGQSDSMTCGCPLSFVLREPLVNRIDMASVGAQYNFQNRTLMSRTRHENQH